jgi:hypothetical protein
LILLISRTESTPLLLEEKGQGDEVECNGEETKWLIKRSSQLFIKYINNKPEMFLSTLCQL